VVYNKILSDPIGICTFGKSTKTMKAIIFGATGMIGKGVLLECLDHAEVAEVLSIGRSRIELSHAKLRQIEHRDFLDFSAIASELQGYDACFFCLGISAAGMQEAEYKRITYDFAMTCCTYACKDQSGNDLYICFRARHGFNRKGTHDVGANQRQA
jgi:hypothetical protein